MMSSTIIYERYLWFHNEIKNNRHPNALTLAKRFEITGKTAQRNIAFMRDRLKAPLRYVPGLRGYEYEDNTWELPGLWLHEDELISLVLSFRLATEVPDNHIKTALKKLLNQIVANHTTVNIGINEISEKISVKHITYARTGENIFHRLLDMLMRGQPIRIEYYSPHNDQSTERDILPLHLINYMGTWHIIAYCNVKKELRDFVVSRIKSVAVCSASITACTGPKFVKDYIQNNFGILRGKDTVEVRLRFAGDIAPWIAEQNWHPDQKISMGKDGRLTLALPVADFREIKREILRYGAQVEVISPAALRNEIKKEIEKMKNIYS
jgi:predicted DNA-binding transcriptional regulator YafY